MKSTLPIEVISVDGGGDEFLEFCRYTWNFVRTNRYRFYEAMRMRAVGSVCENGNAVASLRENGDEMKQHKDIIVSTKYL